MIRHLLAIALCACSAAAAQSTILIRGARVLDGAGAPARRADVRIAAGRIAAVGKLKAGPAEVVVDARGLVLTPGFIDIHNHSIDIDRDPGAATQVSQGITTIVVGQDGSSAWPIADYLSRLRERPAALNAGILAGHATIRRVVMGADFRRAATPSEIARMAELTDQAMREGALGLSSGLEYETGSYSDTAELIAMARAAAAQGGLYISHIRDEGDDVFAAIREAIRIGEEARIPVEVTHIKLATSAVWGKAEDAIALIEDARRRGLDVTADCYPYDAWSSTITVLVPDKRTRDPQSVARSLESVGGAGNVTVTSCKSHPEFEWMTLEAIAAKLGATPVRAYIKIVEDGGATVVCRAMKDADIRAFYQRPWVMVASDGGIGSRHPRGAGTFPRVLGVFVRERKWLTLSEAVRKMTSAPAARLKLNDRGVIRKGSAADIVLFDARRVKDQSTYTNPSALAAGIEKVFVNGEVVWDNGKVTGARPGRVMGH